MAIISKLTEGAIYKVGILAAGVICLCFARSGYLPRYTYPLSLGLTSFGILALIVGLREIPSKDSEDEDDDFNREGKAERMAEFLRLKPGLIEHLNEQRRLSIEFELDKRRELEVEFLKREAQRLEEEISAYEGRLARYPLGRLRRQRQRGNQMYYDDIVLAYSNSSMSLDRTARERLLKFYSL